MDGGVKVFRNEKSKRSVAVSTMEASFIRSFAIYSKEGNLIGHSNVLTHIINGEDGKPEKMANILIDITIYDEKDRRQGAASELMEVITGLYDKVVTGGSTPRGKALCYKFGFKDVGGLFKNQAKALLYVREEKNAVDSKGQEGSSGDAQGIRGEAGGTGLLRLNKQGEDQGSAQGETVV